MATQATPSQPTKLPSPTTLHPPGMISATPRLTSPPSPMCRQRPSMILTVSPNWNRRTAWGAPSHAQTFLINSDGSFVYKPAAGYYGTDSFTYKCTDGQGDSLNTATVSLNVTDRLFVPTKPTLDGSTLYTMTVPAATGTTGYTTI